MHTMALSSQIVGDKQLFDDLWKLIREGTPPIPQRAAWVLSYTLESNPALMEPYFGDVLPLLRKEKHDAVHRALIRSLGFIKIPEEIEGELYDLALAWIASPAKAVALRIFSMDVAANIAMPYPELRDEVVAVIEAQMDWGSAGYKSRGKRVIKRLKKG